MQTEHNITQVQEFSLSFKLIAVLCGGFLTGSLWRIRGESGYGGMWGMFVVATGLTLFIFSLYRGRKKLSYTMLPLTVLFTACTVGGWGTINRQMAGRVIQSTISYMGENSTMTGQINPWSGLVMMLILGFGWLPLFAFLMGSYFSHKRYRFRHAVTVFVLFEAVFYLAKATIAHPVMRWIAPDAVRMFHGGLAQQGITATPYIAYLQHFDSDTWAKTVHFGRNYFTSVELISSLFGAIAVLLFIRFMMKDRRGFRIALGINCIMSLSITIADIGMVAGEETSLFRRDFLQEWFQFNYNWEHWEYCTGFLFGIGVTALLLSLSRKKLAESDQVKAMIPPLGGRPGFAYHSFITLFAMLGLPLLRPFILRVLDENATLRAGSTLGSVLVVSALAVIFLITVLYTMRKNILIGALKQPFNVPCTAFCTITLLLFYIMHHICYGFSGEGNYLQSELSDVSMLMLLSCAVVCISYCTILQLQKKQLHS